MCRGFNSLHHHSLLTPNHLDRGLLLPCIFTLSNALSLNSMNLVLDEGNTAFKLAIYDGDKLLRKAVFEPHEHSEMHTWIRETTTIQQLIVSSVVDKGLDVSAYAFRRIRLNHTVPLPIVNNYETPQSLGNDRIANAVAARCSHPDENVLVIDLGTCLKYDIVRSDGHYLGGAISPGMEMRFKALHHFTDRLPLLKEHIQSPWGYGATTVQSIYKGVVQGMYHEINGFIQRYQATFSTLTVLITGGDMPHFDRPFVVNTLARQTLTLDGLNEILMYNVQDC